MKKKIVVVGSGVAGLTCALSLIENGHEVVLITKSQTSDSATWYAQGGVASAMFSDDTFESHIKDTLDAGGQLCNVDAVRILVENGPQALSKLISRGAHFDLLADGSYARTKEGGHSTNRIIHAGGDATGEEIERSLVKATSDISLDNLSIFDYRMVTRLLVHNRRCVGVECIDANGSVSSIETDEVVLATGGAGQLFSVTTNPVLSTGDGISLALSSGVLCTDLEFMQFHPTALHVDNMPRPLISEALRGEGAKLLDDEGVAFMAQVHQLGDLAPRDIVSKEIAKVLRKKKIDHVFLDATNIDNFSQRFPTIYASCEAVGINPTKDYLPVSPAAHYYCGGVATDLWGATSLDGLWAAGEVACNGIHGANRLASNSLLEGLVFGEQVSTAISTGVQELRRSGLFSSCKETDALSERLEDARQVGSQPDRFCKVDQVGEYRVAIQKTMNAGVGVVRNEIGLKEALSEIESIKANAVKDSKDSDDVANDFSAIELNHLFNLAQVMVKSAQLRKESRGCHSRDDYVDTSGSFLGRFYTSLDGEDFQFIALRDEK